jgi:hypothetical protein
MLQWAHPLREVQYERHSFDVDVKTCPKCAGRLEVRAVVTDPATTTNILTRLARAPPRAA